MHIRLLPLLATALLLSACGNKADLLQPRQVPPEDRGRYIFKSSIPTQEQLDAEADAAWDAEADAESDTGTDSDADAETDADADDTAPPAVPLILDVPPATGTP